MAYYNPTPNLQVSEHFFTTSLSELWYFQAPKFVDERGFFSEVINLPELEEVTGKPFTIKQVNFARSEENVVRGLHAEGWNKLVFVNEGEAFSAIADIQPNSPTYKQTEYFKLGYDHDTQQGNGLFISKGLANSVAVLKGPINYLYLVNRLYQDREKADEQAISIFDPQLNIEWPIDKEKMILSDRDKQAINLSELKR